MKLKKIFAMLLAGSMLLVGTVGCETGSDTETKDTETKGSTGDETVLDRRDVPDDLPDITFNGKDFRFYVNEGEYFQLVFRGRQRYWT